LHKVNYSDGKNFQKATLNFVFKDIFITLHEAIITGMKVVIQNLSLIEYL